MFSCPIRVHSWFKHCLDYVFAYSCPFVVLPLHPPSCFFVLFVVQTPLGPRFFAYSCPFVSIRGSPPSPFFVFFVLFVLFVVQTLLGLRFCIFVSIRVHSWFSLFTLLRVFSCFSCISWFDSPFTCLMRRVQARHPRTTLSSLLPSPFSLFVHFYSFQRNRREMTNMLHIT